MKKKEAFVIADEDVSEKPPLETIAQYTATVLNIISAISFFIIVGLLYQDFHVEYTYFRTGTTTCQLYYELSLNRFFLLGFALNIIDIKASFAIGLKLWGGFVIISNVIAVVLNSVLLLIIFFAYMLFCNADGYGFMRNMCDNKLLCGINAYRTNTANLCEFRNPTGLDIYPAIALDDVRWSWDMNFILFLIAFAVFYVACLIKSLLNFTLPEGTSFIKKTVQTIQKITKAIKTKIEKKEKTTDDKGEKFELKNLYPKMPFFELWTKRQVSWYVMMIAIDWMFTIFLIGWFGWFQQNSLSITEGFTAAALPVPNASYFSTTHWANYVFYALFGLNIFLNGMITFMGQTFLTEIAIIGSGIGFILNLGLLFYGLIAYTITANKFNNGFNIANNRKEYCATVGFTSPNCPNYQLYNCTTTYPLKSMPLDLDYVILIIGMIYGLIYFGIIFIYSVALNMRFKKFVRPSNYDPLLSKDENEEEEGLTDEIPTISSSIDSRIGYIDHIKKAPYNYRKTLPDHFIISSRIPEAFESLLE
jgi:hypothetical protein